MKFINFLKSRLIFNILLFLNVCKQTFHRSHMDISESKKYFKHKIYNILFSYEDKGIGRFSNLH